MGFNRLKYVYLVGFCLIVALPLLSLPPWFSPPDWGKTIVFRIIMSFLIFLFLYQILSQKNYTTFSAIAKNIVSVRFRENKALWLLILLFLIFLLATIFSLDPSFSFWGSPYRSGGFLNFSFYIICGILAFLVLKKDDWQKLWNVAIIFGVLVAILAIFQWQGFFKDILITYETRPPGSLGNPIMLALYLLLLSFLTLSFAVKERVLFKKILYGLALFLFVFVIALTYSRAAYFGLAVGFLYFIFFYPYRKRTISLALKLGLLLIFFLGVYGIYYVNTQPQLPEFIQENRTLRGIAGRLSIERALQDARISGWKVSWEALKDRPILGYGPENFAIGFDRHYDPALPGIEKMPGIVTSWWDRAHNFVFDISLTAGIPALLIYLSLFGVLFWRFQKLKAADKNADDYADRTLIAQGVQAAFIGYLVANFFSFDTFSIYLILFLLIGYSLFLIKQEQDFNLPPGGEKEKKRHQLFKYKTAVIFILFVLLVWFIWAFNLKPLQINSQINIAKHLAEKERCDLALKKMEKILPQKSFLDGYLRLEYASVISRCIKEKEPAEAYPLVKKVIEVLKENTEIWPYHTRNWLSLGKYNNILMKEEWEEGKGAEAEAALEKAFQLSPKRQEVLTELIKTYLLKGKYQEAKEKSEECLNLNEKLAECWWLMGLSHIYLEEQEKADEYLKAAGEKRYPVKAKDSWLDLTRAYIKTNNYPGLVETYSALINLEPENAQYHASLAFVYKELGQIEEAKKIALKIIELFPEHKAEAEEFLKTLE